MTPRLASLLLCCAALLGPLCARAACPELIGTFEVGSAQVAPELNDSVAAVELTRVAQLSRPGPTDGLTDVQIGYRASFGAGPRRAGCPTHHVAVRFVADVAVVYLARELDSRGCRYRAVYDHELLHVQIGQRAMDFAADFLRDSLRRAPAFAADFEPLGPSAAMRAWLERELARAVEAANARYTQQNDELDRPAEARRLEALCDTSVQFQLGARVRRLD